MGVSVDDIGDSSDEEDDSDDASSIGYQDHKRGVGFGFGLDPGRIYVIPNAIATEKFKPYPRKQTDKSTDRLTGKKDFRTNFFSNNRRAFSTGLSKGYRFVGSSRSPDLCQVPPR